MPNISNLKPIIKITEKQWKGILERVLSKEGGIKPQALQQPIESMMPREPVNFGQVSGPVQPAPIPQYGTAPIDQLTQAVDPIDRTMGRLYQPREGVGNLPMDYPLAEAKMRALKDPNLIPENNPRIPPTTRLRTVPSGAQGDMTNPDEFAKGLAYERLNWKPIESKFDRTNKAFIEQAAQEVGIPLQKEEVANMATVFGDLWKKLGGPRSEARTYWEALRRTSRQKDNIPDARSYFIQSATKWKERNAGFSKQYPRESKRMEEVWSKYMGGE